MQMLLGIFCRAPENERYVSREGRGPSAREGGTGGEAGVDDMQGPAARDRAPAHTVLYPSNGLGSGRAMKKPKSTFSVIQALKFCSLVFGYYFANSFGELFPCLAYRGLDPSLLTPPPPALARLREQ